MTERSDRFDLVVTSGPLRGTRYPLMPGRHLIGRGSACDLTLDDPEISRRHLDVIVDEHGIRIVDAGSTNGTFVEGRPVEGEIGVDTGIAIEIGGSTIRFVTAAPPDRVSREELPLPREEWIIPIGFGPHSEPVEVDLSVGHLVVAGPYRSGRSSALVSLAIAASRLEQPPDLHLLAPRRSPLTDLTVWDSVAVGRDDVELAISGLGGMVSRASKAVIFLDDADDLFDTDDREFESVLRAGRDTAVRFVIATEIQEAHRTFGGWFVEARKQRHALVLQPDADLDGDLFGARLPGTDVAIGPGRGYLISGGRTSLVQVACDAEQ